MGEDINAGTIQVIAIIGSIVFVVFILLLIRNKKLKEEFSLLWLFFSVVLLILSIWRKSFDLIACYLGIAYAPAALFLILIMAIISILIHFSLVLSRLTNQTKSLVQEVGLLNMKNEKVPDETITGATQPEKLKNYHEAQKQPGKA